MQKIAKFEKVSYKQFKEDWQNCYPEYQGNDTDIKDIYDQIHLPKRATTGSAGCDFFSPSNLTIYPNGVQIISDNPFQIYPRSSLGFKYGIHLANTVGIIDSDYYNSDNEGHIFVKLINDSSIRDAIKIEAGQAFCQGIFTSYGVTYDDNADRQRNGGFGSTDNT